MVIRDGEMVMGTEPLFCGDSSRAEQVAPQPDGGSTPTTPLQLHIVPLTLAQANELVAKWHRHHKPVVGHRFSVGVADENDVLHGAAIVDRPVGRMTDQYAVAEITRLVTDRTPNACSFLYAACTRIAREMGFYKIQTFILAEEPGTSLKAAGWKFEANSDGGDWNHSWRKGRRTDQPMTPKQKWSKVFGSTLRKPKVTV